jgi:hypothetical protein
LLLAPNFRCHLPGADKPERRDIIKKFVVAEELEPPQILGPLSPTNQENYTVTLGGQTTIQCAVRSLGPTQIQWLKQLHDHQAPTDRNKTIVVFDYIFEASV